jgi:O-antigen/teichoic acid export membrane protein
MWFSMMGISIIGIREVAKDKNNPQALSTTFSSLLTLNFIATFIVLIVLVITTCLVSQLREHWQLMLVGGVKVLFNMFLIEWLFKGIEDFKYITIRSLVIRILFVVAVFIFVRNADDYIVYFILMCLLHIINALFNWWYKGKFVSFNIHSISLKPYFKSFMVLGCYVLLSSLYTSFNIAYLGFVGGETEVGYYTTAIKLYTILLSMFTAFTGVMLPRMSALVSEKNILEVQRLISKSFELLISFSIPLIVWTTIFAPEIIRLIAGDGYEGAIIPMRIITPLILIIGLEQIIVLQILMPLKADRSILINSVIGASIGLTANILLVKSYFSVGSSVVWVISEFAVLISAFFFVRELICIKISMKTIFLNFLWGGILSGICLSLRYFHISQGISLLMLSAGTCCLLSFIFQIFIVKNNLFRKILYQLKNKS